MKTTPREPGSDQPDPLKGLSPAKRELARRRLAQIQTRAVAGATVASPIARAPRVGDLPLSFAQQRLWFVDRLEGPSALYNEFAGELIEGPLDVGALDRALAAMVRRHEILRTRFPAVGGVPVQRIVDDLAIPLQAVDLQELTDDARDAAVRRAIENEAREPFNLADGPLARFRLLRLAPDRHILLASMHHIVCDRWSTAVFVDELACLYAAFVNGEPSPLADLPIQYADYSVWQRSRSDAPEADDELREWCRALGGAPFVLDVPADRRRPAQPGTAGGSVPLVFGQAATAAIRDFSRRHGVTPFMTLHAALVALLYRYTGRDDIVIGAPIAQRDRPETQRLIGFFVNTLPLRVAFDPQAAFTDLVERTRRADADALGRQETPLERIVQELQPERSASHSPLFQILFAYQSAPPRKTTIPGLSLRPIAALHVSAKFDLTLEIGEEDDGFAGRFEYSTDLFDRSRVARLCEHFRNLVAAAVAEPDRRVADLPMVGPAEHEQLRSWRGAATPSPEVPSLHEQIATQAGRSPAAAAIVCGEVVVSYAELDDRSSRLARSLRRLGVGPDVLVGLCTERSPEMIVALVAILKSGGAYLPLDPGYPRDRLRFMLDDSRAALVIGAADALARLERPAGVRAVSLDDLRDEAGGDAVAVMRPSGGSDLAYVIYTSGSTGRPKGVEVEHRGLANLAVEQSRAFDVRSGDRVLQFASLNFDASISEIAMALSTGATLVVAPAARLMPGDDLARELRVQRVTHVTLPPSALAVTDPARLPDLRVLVTAGEACPEEVATAWRTGRRLINAYGPTETTVCATIGEWNGVGAPSIGAAMTNMRVAVVDRDGNLSPIGVPGELCIGGVGVARGYRGRPDLTAERFVPDPFAGGAGGRMYRSGDLARFRDDGLLEYLGRVDRQVKLRGYRIELEEIERILDRHPAVVQSAVTVLGAEDNRQLVAYVVADGDVAGVKTFLEQQLPDYMVPSAVVRLAALPLGPSGKIDRARLPRPDGVIAAEAPARDGVEEVIVDLWCRLLNVRHAGVHQSFFELGGHSLLAVRLLARLRDTWAVEIGVREFFTSPTIDSLARTVRERLRVRGGTVLPPIERASRDAPLPLSFAQRRLWFLDQLEGPNATYNISAALRLQGSSLDGAALDRSLDEIVRRHESLRTIFPAIDGVPVQRVVPEVTGILTHVDGGDVPAEQRAAEIERLASAEAGRPFALATGPLVRARLVRLAPDDHLLLVTMHHIVSDGWSMGVLVREMATLYAAYAAGEPSPLPAPTIQYGDFSVWQQQWLSDARLQRQLEFWRAHLAGAPALLTLPTDRPRPAVRTSTGRVEHCELGPSLVAALRTLGGSSGATLFMTLMAGFVTVLSRYSGQDDIVIGSGMANRNHTETEDAIGLFVNTLVLRTDLSGDPTFAELLARVRRTALDSYAHQDLPFERLVEELQPDRLLGQTPLFQVMFALQNLPPGSLDLPGLHVTAVAPPDAAAKFDLTVFLDEHDGGLRVSVVYSSDLFDGPTIARLLRHYRTLLDAAVVAPDRRVTELALFDAGESAALVRTFAPPCAVAASGTVHQRFEAMAARFAARIAVSLDDSAISYADLNRRANQLARRLQALGVGPDALVGLHLERSPDLIVGALAVLKAGGAYVPLDPSHPADRIAFILADCGCRVVVTQQSLAASLPPRDAAVVCLDADAAALAAEDESNPSSSATADHLCYVIYTSGSTGRPKGALICHRNVTRLFDATRPWFGFDERDVWTLFHSSAFDFSVWEMWGALLHGGRLVIVSFMTSRSPADFYRLVRREGVTVLNQTPSAFAQFEHVEAEVPAAERIGLGDALRLVIFGGEALDVRTLRPWFERHGDETPQLVNMYGITETTVHVTYRPLTLADVARGGSVIGVPIPDLQLYVLDRHMQPVPPGVAGELYVGGGGVARGYLNRPELTAERFVANPFAGDGSIDRRLYRTGDLVRVVSGPELEYAGRIDEQIKIRGFRVEPGEIEAALGEHGAVHGALVLARADAEDDRRLVAYVVPRADTAGPVHRLLQWERDGRADGHALFQLPDGTAIAHLNRLETEFVYDEIFEHRSYLRHGIALTDGACVFDVGANIGLFSLFVARACRHPRLYAFEPVPDVFACLRFNAELHGLDARVFECGLASAARQDAFTFYPNVSIISGRFGDLEAEKQSVRAFLQRGYADTATTSPDLVEELLDDRLRSRSIVCDFRTLSDVVEQEGIESIDLLKIDVEKSELDVLGGIRDEHWPRIRQVIVEVHSVNGRLDAVTSILRARGFTVALDRDAVLTDSDLWNVYARRPGEPKATKSADQGHDTDVPAVWSSPDALVAALKRHLTAKLPVYMVPGDIILLDRFPLTVNGKVDRKALPAPHTGSRLESSAFRAARDETEAALASIFGDVLRLARVDIGHSFFDIGGHSLLATQVVSRVRETLRIELPLQALFEAPTVERLAVIVRTQVGTAQPPPAPQIPRRSSTASRLSFAQERLWFLDQLEPENPFYNVPVALRIHGPLDAGVLQRSLQAVVARHDVLRARFAATDGKPVQHIRPVSQARLDLAASAIDLSALSADERLDRVAALAAAESRRPFNLSRDLLFRATLLRLADDDAVLLLTLHHIVSDGWSLGVLVQELGALYEALSRGLESPLPALPIQYADFAAWQREWLGGEVLDQQLRYWKATLANAAPVLDLPTDRSRPAVQTFQGRNLSFEVPAAVTAGLRAVSRQADATLFMTLLAAFATLLHRHSGQQDIVIGSPVANRNRLETESLVGFFVNTLALRTDLSGDPSFADLLRRVRETAIEAYAHQDLPFERLVDEIQPERDLSLNPLFQVMFALQNAPLAPLQLSGLRVEPLALPATTALFDLVLDVWETGETLTANLQFNTDLFDEPTVARLADQYRHVLRAVAAAPSLLLSRIPLLTETEEAALLALGTGSPVAYPLERLVPAAFEAHAASQPTAVAVRHGGVSVDYATVNARANRIAHALRAAGVARGAFVAIVEPRGADLVAAMLGILKAGAAFVPIDPDYPAARIQFMVSDSGATAVVTRRSVWDGLAVEAGAVTLLWLDGPAVMHAPASNPVQVHEPRDVAYLLYTSGSTGVPKGAMVRHDGMAHHIYAEAGLLALDAGMRFLQSAPSSSDISVWQLLGPGVIGGRTVIVDAGTVADPRRLYETLVAEAVTVIELVPVVMKGLLGEVARRPEGGRTLPALTCAMVTGEAAPVALANAWVDAFPDVPLVNAYGPTEAADDICQHAITTRLPADARTVPIGRPLPNLRLYVLDSALRVVPVGVTGEICVSGIAVGAGYRGDDMRTAAAFAANPYARDPLDAVLYRTGDRGRWRSDGTLECLGRLDQQIKLRGFRIELGEIEGVIARHPSVSTDAVALKSEASDAAEETRLVAYVVPDAASAEARRQASAVRDVQIDQWLTLHDDSYTDARLIGGDPTLNVIGWDSNYTKAPLPDAEMFEYIDATTERILALHPRRLLEIGCGTGLLLFRLVPHCEAYCGTDLSRVAIGRLQSLQRDPDLRRRVHGLDRARLEQRRADDLDGLAERFDTIILPSVVQYFPGSDYLDSALASVFARLEPGGSVFVGDVRSLPLLDTFHLSLQLHRSPEATPARQLLSRLRDHVAREQELALAPAFFADLPRRFPQITSVEILPKRGLHRNELTCFRYDVCIRTAPRDAVPSVRWDGWTPAWTVERIREALQDGPAGTWGLRRVPNARTFADAAVLARIAERADGATIGELRDWAAGLENDGIDPEALWALETAVPYRVHLSQASGAPSGAFDVAFVPAALADATPVFADPAAPVSTPEYANDPLQEKLRREIASTLRAFLRGRLPQYMTPSDFVVLTKLPLTPAGKVDRDALPDPPALLIAGNDYVAPRTPAEAALCRIWSDVLGVERVGIRNNFFDLGGHSLKATQVVGRVLRDLQIELPVRELFASPTIEELAPALRGAARPHAATIPRVDDADDYPLSHAQRRLWVLCRLEPGSTAYNMPGAVQLEGAVDALALQRALDRLVERHESLRTAFVIVNGEPRQRVLRHLSRRLEVIDLTDCECPEEAARARALEDARRPFDLEAGGLVRASLLILGADRFVLLFNVHHIVSDDLSGSVLVREFMQLYAGADDAAPLPPLPIQYRDYAVWQNARLDGDEMAAHRAYWLEKLAGDLPALDLPADRRRPAAKTYNGRTVSFSLTAAETEGVNTMARADGVTLFMVLVAAVKVLLFRYTGQQDLIVGFPIAGRTHPDLDGQIGFFINMLPLRDRVDGAMPFGRVLQQVARTAREAYEHQEYPFDRLVNDLDLARDTSRTPLFDVIVVLQNAAAVTLTLPSVEVEPFAVEYGFSKFDLSFTFEESGGRLRCDLIYNPDLFDEARIERVGAHFRELVRRLLDDRQQHIGDVNILPDAERRLIAGWSRGDGRRGLGRLLGKSLVDAFTDVAAKWPDNVALTAPGDASGGPQHVTYDELNTRADRVAGRLRARGIGSGALVGLFTARSVEMIVGILGILKAGAAYVPIDPAYPAERVRFMIDDAAVGLVLTQQPLVSRLPARLMTTVLCLDDEGEDVRRDDGPASAPSPSDAAYVIYTSGSTGQPKGVVVTHHNVTRLFAATDDWFAFADSDVWTLFHSYAFDFSVWEIWGALLFGGRLVVVPQPVARSPEAFYRLVADERVTILNQTPSAFRALMPAAIAAGSPLALRRVIFGGEALDIPSLRPWFEAFGDVAPQLVNMYGITETTVHVTYRPLSTRDLDRPGSVVGVPIPDLRVYVLDDRRQPVPIGVPGELYVGGKGVARGYLGRPELTADRFVHYGPSSERVYRTGDLARYLPDGDLEYLGRADQQVKIRGFRIELAEIETALVAHPDVGQAVVIASAHADGRRLIAYVVPRDRDPDTADVRAFLHSRLPEYMMPSAFIVLPALPLTTNGKLDRDALPAPDAVQRAPAAFTAPSTGLEETIAAVLRDVLQLERLDAHDNFFDVGADSLALALAHPRIREATGREVTLLALYEHPTVSALAAALTNAAAPALQKQAIDARAAKQRQARTPRPRR